MEKRPCCAVWHHCVHHTEQGKENEEVSGMSSMVKVKTTKSNSEQFDVPVTTVTNIRWIREFEWWKKTQGIFQNRAVTYQF